MLISIRPLTEDELTEADRIFRLAFGTFKNDPHPETYGGATTYIKRWYADPNAAFGAFINEKLVGSNFAINWGSFGLFGPLTVHPDFWGRGIAQQLIDAAVKYLNQLKVENIGFFTFSNSPAHLNLYQKFAFYPGFLTTLLSKQIQSKQKLPGLRYSQISNLQQQECLHSARELTNTIYQGLDLSKEIQVVEAQNLGDTILLFEEKRLMGLGICHYGVGTEAENDTCYVKFGAVRSHSVANKYFAMLLQGCETLGAIALVSRLVCGINTARHEAYLQMLSLGFSIDRVGVAMHKPSEFAFNRSDVYIIDDWR